MCKSNGAINNLAGKNCIGNILLQNPILKFAEIFVVHFPQNEQRGEPVGKKYKSTLLNQCNRVTN